jgi:hypothetical protein
MFPKSEIVGYEMTENRENASLICTFPIIVSRGHKTLVWSFLP